MSRNDENSRNQPSRRDMLTGLGAAIGVATIGGCGSDTEALGVPDASTVSDGSTPVDGAVPDASFAATCNEPSTMLPAEILAHIDTFVVLCMENRSFDHYLGALRLIEGRMDVDGLNGSETNPTSLGAASGIYNLDTFTPGDPPHSWDECHVQWNNGANDGFVSGYDDNGESMGYYVREQIPQMYALADQGAICHHWYASLLGPTWPNRFYLHGATSEGRKGNALPITGFRSIFSLLDDAGISNLNYYHDTPWASVGYFKLGGNSGIENFFEHAANGSLPQFSIIDPKFLPPGANDDHPAHDVRLGQALISSVVAALGQSPHWERSLFILTYDEHGGFYDHVPPPQTEDERADFRQLGFRVPSLVIGPTVRRGCAIDTVFEHVSVIATMTERFGLPVLNDRVRATSDLSPCIDPELIGDPQPPPDIPPVEVSLRALENWPVKKTHDEISEVAARIGLPAHLVRRDEDMAITRTWLAHAEKLGAVRFVD